MVNPDIGYRFEKPKRIRKFVTKRGEKRMTKNNNYQNCVIEKVLALSVEKKNYDLAKREWEYCGEVTDHGPLKDQIPKPAECQFCGHKIRYGYRLHNVVNNKIIEVGSECIGNYLEITHVLASALDTDKRTARKRRKNQQLKMRRDLYNTAMAELRKVRIAVCAFDNCQKDRNYILSAGNNASTLYSALASGEIDRLAENYGVTLDQKKIQAFMHEAGKVKTVDLITAF